MKEVVAPTSIEKAAEPTPSVEPIATPKNEEAPIIETAPLPTKPSTPPSTGTEPKFSALSLASIKARKELIEAQKGFVKEEEHLPTESFTATQMLEIWYKYADRLGEKGHRIMESLLRISDPVLEGTKITHVMPNEGSKIDFDREKYDLLTYLRSHLHNHDISIEVIVNEEIKSKIAFTPQDKFNRLNEINPNLEKLKKMFDLEL